MQLQSKKYVGFNPDLIHFFSLTDSYLYKIYMAMTLVKAVVIS